MKQTLYGSQDSSDVVGGAPPVLENVEAEFTIGIYVWMKHPRQELDLRRLVRIRLVKGKEELEGAVLKGCLRYENMSGAKRTKGNKANLGQR